MLNKKISKGSNIMKDRRNLASKSGAGDGTRTRDNLLGRQGLYQLSYSRRAAPILVAKR